MKRSILLFATLLFVFASFAQNKDANTSPICQEPTNDRGTQALPWAEMQMWTATDIKGNTHNLADYLATGKTVFVDFSATWCYHCWSFHQSGVLENLHNQFGPGPDGTNEIVVLWFEVDGATIEQIHGTGSNTQGDWTENDTWPVPIIQASSQLKSYFSELYPGAVPTMFMICPTGYYRTVDASTSVSYYMSQINSCPEAGQVPLADIDGSAIAFIDTPSTFQADAVSIDPITGYEWTFENGDPATSDQPNVGVTWNTPGQNIISLKIHNENGPSSPKYKTVKVIDPATIDNNYLTFEEIPVGNTYPKNLYPYSWTSVNRDNGTVYGSLTNYGVSGNNMSFVVYSKSATSPSHLNVAPKSGDKCALAMTNASGGTNNDWLISPKIQLGTNSSFEAYVKSLTANYGLEKYKIMISTTNTEEASFTMLGSVSTAPVNWTKITRDLSAYDGQEVYIALVYVGYDNFIFFADDIKITTTPTAIETNNLELEARIFPNPANDVININYVEGAKIQIFNNIGQEVYSLANANEYNQIDMSAHQAGSYVVRVTKGDKTNNYKMILVK